MLFNIKNFFAEKNKCIYFAALLKGHNTIFFIPYITNTYKDKIRDFVKSPLFFWKIEKKPLILPNKYFY